MIENAEGLPPAVRSKSVEVFTALAEAEAATHGVTIDQVNGKGKNDFLPNGSN